MIFPPSRPPAMSFADVLEVVGGMGRFQFIYVLLLAFPVILTTSHHLLQNFVAIVPDHRCQIPPADANSSEGGAGGGGPPPGLRPAGREAAAGGMPAVLHAPAAPPAGRRQDAGECARTDGCSTTPGSKPRSSASAGGNWSTRRELTQTRGERADSAQTVTQIKPGSNPLCHQYCLNPILIQVTGSAVRIDLQGFGVDIYLIQVIFGAVDVPVKLVGFFAMTYVGRRFTQATFLILAGSIMLANIFIPKELQVLRTSLAALGKGCLAAAYTCCFLYTSELYPTVLRQTGLGLVNMMARIGSMVAPILRLVGGFVPSLPLVIYGGTAILVSTAATTFLRETLNAPLPDTIQEVESREKGGAKKVNEVTRGEIPLEETRTSLIKQNV